MILYPIMNPQIRLMANGSVNLFGHYGDLMIKSGILHRSNNVWRDEKGVRKFFYHKSGKNCDMVEPCISNVMLFTKLYTNLFDCNGHYDYCDLQLFAGPARSALLDYGLCSDEFISMCSEHSGVRKTAVKIIIKKTVGELVVKMGYKSNLRIHCTPRTYAKYKMIVDDNRRIFLNDLSEETKRIFRAIFNEL